MDSKETGLYNATGLLCAMVLHPLSKVMEKEKGAGNAL